MPVREDNKGKSEGRLNQRFNPEMRLLLECVRPGGPKRDCLLELLHGGIDWRRLVQLALAHGVVPASYGALQALPSGLVSATTAGQLERLYLSNARTVLRLTDELGVLIDALQAEGIQAIAFKGPLLAARLHGDPIGRQFSDIDLLVRQSDFWRVVSLLTSLGYAADTSFTEHQKAIYLRHDCALYLRSNNNLFLDLQFRFTPDFIPVHFDYNAVFERAVEVVFEGRRVWSLCDDDWLMYLALHGCLHTWAKLRYLVDMAGMVESYSNCDYHLLLEKAERAGIRPMVLMAIGLCARLLNVPVTPWLRETIERERSIKRLERTAARRLIGGGGNQPGGLETFSIRMTMLEGGWARCLYKRAVDPSATDWRFVGLPDRLYFLYYLVRPFRLALQALKFVTRKRSSRGTVPA